MEKWTFKSIFEADLSVANMPLVRTIEIPSIQRDYAQGRAGNDVRRIRHRLLEALRYAVTSDRPITLDFVRIAASAPAR